MRVEDVTKCSQKTFSFLFKKTIYPIAEKQISAHHVKANKNKKHIFNKCIHHKQPLVVRTKKQIKKAYCVVYLPLHYYI